MAPHNEFGKWGEDTAMEYLRRKGYTVVERDWRFRRYDIDLITIHNGELVFVEVKTRRNNLFGEPYEAVNHQKCRNLLTAANAYIHQKNTDLPWRFDIVSITGTPANYFIEQIEGALTSLAW